MHLAFACPRRKAQDRSSWHRYELARAAFGSPSSIKIITRAANRSLSHTRAIFLCFGFRGYETGSGSASNERERESSALFRCAVIFLLFFEVREEGGGGRFSIVSQAFCRLDLPLNGRFFSKGEGYIYVIGYAGAVMFFN